MNNYRRLARYLTEKNESYLYQLSVARAVSEATAHFMHYPDYFNRLCSNFAITFNSSLCALFRMKKEAAVGWELDSWSRRLGGYSPASDYIPSEDGSLLDWIRDNDSPLYLDGIEDDSIVRFWDAGPDSRLNVALIPLKIDEITISTFMLIDPIIPLQRDDLIRFLEIVRRPIELGAQNHELYIKSRTSEDAFRDLFANASDMVVVLSADGKVIESNEIFKKKLKLHSDPTGCHITELMKRHDSSFSETLATLQSGDEVHNVDVRIENKSGHILDTELSGNIRKGPNGEIDAFRLYMRDETEKRKIESERLHLEMQMKLMRQRELAQMGLHLSGVMHNLQNPLHVCVGSLDILKLKGVELSELDHIEKATSRIVEIVQNLLDKARKEQNAQKTEININNLLKSELTFLNADRFFKHETEKYVQFDKNIPLIEGIYGDFSQVVMNIISNALDAMKDSTEKVLEIRTEFRPKVNDILIAISDTGPGMSEEVRERIFDPFFTTKKKLLKDNDGLSPGSGLGLSMAKTLLAPYGGDVCCESRVSKGTTFYITLPVKNDEKCSEISPEIDSFVHELVN